MPQTFTAAAIVRYENKQGMAGKLLGILTLTDGRSLNVWEPELHARCKELALFPPHEIRYQLRPSQKWGDALTKIESSKTDYELMSLAREREEAPTIGHSKAGKFVHDQISKRVQRHLDNERKGVSIDEVVERH